jgi:mono/diheme cytochrome c family protein
MWLAAIVSGAAALTLTWTEIGRAQQPPAAPEPPAVEDVQPTQSTADEPQEPPAAPSPCAGLGQQPGRFPGLLSAVPRYGSTYVLVVPQRLAETIPNATAPAVKGLHVGVEADSSAADAARALGITNIEPYPFEDSDPFRLLRDVRDEKLDAAVLWAPLAGLGIIDLGLDGLVSIFSVDKPHAAPPAMRATAVDDPCVLAIAEELDVSGVLPAELLVSVEIRDLLGMRAPAVDLAKARQGGEIFNTTCARCHGADAVADPKGLAPVDLRISIRRFSYPGFHYIVLNGRPSKSMPPFRGTVTADQISMIYQYLKARSDKTITVSQTATPSE